MPTTLSTARFGIESSFGLSPTLIGASNWHFVDPTTPGLTTEQNSIWQSPRWGYREQRRPVAGPITAGGTLSVQLNPVDGIQLLYVALGTCNTTNNADATYTHKLTPGNTLRSIFYEEYIYDGTGNNIWNRYPGTTIDAFTINGVIDDAVTVDYTLHSAFRYADASLALPDVLNAWSYLAPFTGCIGSITKRGVAWYNTDNWVINVNLGLAHKRTWGWRKWYGACVGTVTADVSCNTYFASRDVLQEFMGDVAHNLATGPLGIDDGLYVVDDMNFTAHTDQLAGAAHYYTMQVYLPRVTWETVGPMEELDDCIRLPITGRAHWDPHDLYSIRIDITNTLTNAQMTSAIA